MREIVLEDAASLLQMEGFEVTSFVHINSCFDLIAKRPGLMLIIKVYSNIDAVREEQAWELEKVADIFNATALLIGERTKAFRLEDGTIYERYGLPAVTVKSLGAMLEGRMPEVRSFKGRSIAEVDSSRLRERRREMGLTLEQLAERIGLSVESVHSYEKGANASLESIKKMEEVLHTSIAKKIDLLRQKPRKQKVYDEGFEDEVLAKVHNLGLRLAVFGHAPFRAYSEKDESLLIQEGRKRQEIERKAVELEKTKKVLGPEGMIIAKEYRHEAAGGIPVISEEELDSMGSYRDLRELIIKRKKGC